MRKLCPFFPLTVAHPSGTLLPHRKAAWAVITLWFAQDEVMQVSTVISLCPPLFWLSFWNELGLFVKVTCPSSVGVMLQLDWLQSWCLWEGEISSIPNCSISLSVPKKAKTLGPKQSVSVLSGRLFPKQSCCVRGCFGWLARGHTPNLLLGLHTFTH